jgi:hypothetical protein
VKIGQIGKNLKWRTQARTGYTIIGKSNIFLFIKKKDDNGRKKVKENKAK